MVHGEPKMVRLDAPLPENTYQRKTIYMSLSQRETIVIALGAAAYKQRPPKSIHALTATTSLPLPVNTGAQALNLNAGIGCHGPCISWRIFFYLAVTIV